MQESKYKIGDHVWLMRSDRPREMQVIAVVELSERILYGLRVAPQERSYKNTFWGKISAKYGNTLKLEDDTTGSSDEIPLHATDQFYPTKQSLIDSL